MDACEKSWRVLSPTRFCLYCSFFLKKGNNYDVGMHLGVWVFGWFQVAKTSETQVQSRYQMRWEKNNPLSFPSAPDLPTGRNFSLGWPKRWGDKFVCKKINDEVDHKRKKYIGPFPERESGNSISECHFGNFFLESGSWKMYRDSEKLRKNS